MTVVLIHLSPVALPKADLFGGGTTYSFSFVWIENFKFYLNVASFQPGRVCLHS